MHKTQAITAGRAAHQISSGERSAALADIRVDAAGREGLFARSAEQRHQRFAAHLDHLAVKDQQPQTSIERQLSRHEVSWQRVSKQAHTVHGP